MPPLLQSLRETNHRLSAWLDNMLAPQGQPRLATPELMAALLSELMRTGVELRAGNHGGLEDDPVLNGELARYRRHVERLRSLMPSIHEQLLAERAQLESQRARMFTAAQWVQASRQTVER